MLHICFFNDSSSFQILKNLADLRQNAEIWAKISKIVVKLVKMQAPYKKLWHKEALQKANRQQSCNIGKWAKNSKEIFGFFCETAFLHFLYSK